MENDKKDSDMLRWEEEYICFAYLINKASQ